MLTHGFSGTLCYIQDEEDMKETLCGGLWKGVVEHSLPVVSKQDAEQMLLNPDINFPTKIREASS